MSSYSSFVSFPEFGDFYLFLNCYISVVIETISNDITNKVTLADVTSRRLAAPLRQSFPSEMKRNGAYRFLSVFSCLIVCVFLFLFWFFIFYSMMLAP